MQTYYDTLGVSKAASRQEIIKAYKKLALQYHPDKVRMGMSGTEEGVILAQIETNTVIFKDISTAYTVLSNPEQRQAYDDAGCSETFQSNQGPGYTANDDRFDSFFKDLPEGLTVPTSSIKDILRCYNRELDLIRGKAQTNSRYQTIAAVIQTLQNDISTSVREHLGDLVSNSHVDADDVYNYLIALKEVLKKAQQTQEPEKHRGYLWGTPIIRELVAPLIYAFLRLLCFAAIKINRYLSDDDRPVFANGFISGLFKRPRTHTQYILEKIMVGLNFEISDLRLFIQESNPGSKGSKHIFADLSDFYFEDETLNMSARP